MDVVKRTRIKICGITTVKDTQVAVQAGADAIGLVFYPPSSRAVRLETAQKICEAVPAFVTTVALFVNPTVDLVAEVIAKTQIDLLQFHGDETPEFCEQFNRPYIKAIRVQASTDLFSLDQAYVKAQGLLLDAYVKGVPGGTGETFNWSLLAPYQKQLKHKIILAGGLVSSNVAEAIATVHPWAVDVSGGVEARPGQKSPEKVIQFINAVNRLTMEKLNEY